MTLVEAIKSGKRFKRKASSIWMENDGGFIIAHTTPTKTEIGVISVEGLLSEDYEIEDTP